jgi:hypothetical protein
MYTETLQDGTRFKFGHLAIDRFPFCSGSGSGSGSWNFRTKDWK